MKKRKGGFIRVLAIIIGAILLVVGGFELYVATDVRTKAKPNDFTENWMSYISDDVLLKSVVIPGSHDCGTNTLLWLGKTQKYDVATQLKMGVRYFDLRVMLTDGQLVIYHGPLKGQLFVPIMEDFCTFLTQHPTETLILDFQHFDGGAQDKVAQVVTQYLATNNYKFVIRNTSVSISDVDFVDALTLGEARGKALITWGSDSDKNLQKDYVFKRNNDDGTRSNSCLQSFYYTELNTGKSKDYVQNTLPLYVSKYQGKGLFVLQGQLTDGLFVFGPRFRERGHNKRMSQYVVDLAETQNAETLSKINVIMRDFVDVKKCCEIIALNSAKGNVQSAKQADFNQKVDYWK